MYRMNDAARNAETQPPTSIVDAELDRLEAARKLGNAESFARDMYRQNLDLRATINMALTCLQCGADDAAIKVLERSQDATR
jgi:hypothetical protein